VVWQGSAGNRCPYADLTGFEERSIELSNWRVLSDRRQIENQKPSYHPCRHLNRRKNRAKDLLLLPFAASFFCNIRHIKKIWRKRVGVEPGRCSRIIDLTVLINV
jgi:hypothetical protein